MNLWVYTWIKNFHCILSSRLPSLTRALCQNDQTHLSLYASILNTALMVNCNFTFDWCNAWHTLYNSVDVYIFVFYRLQRYLGLPINTDTLSHIHMCICVVNLREIILHRQSSTSDMTNIRCPHIFRIIEIPYLPVPQSLQFIIRRDRRCPNKWEISE